MPTRPCLPQYHPGARRAVLLMLLRLATVCLGPEGAAADEARHWEVTVSVRVADESGAPVTLRVALPPDSGGQRLTHVEISARGLDASIVREGEHPHVLLRGPIGGARRVAVTYRVELTPVAAPLPRILPVDAPAAALIPFLTPDRLFQSRSILVRDFLETHAAPLIRLGTRPFMQSIFDVTRAEIKHRGDGKSLALDVIRRRKGKHIGIERAFTTFLRCARIPARFVEGINLTSTTARKRVFWTEMWAQDRWWPASASQGWIGRLPGTHLALARDGTRVVHASGTAKTTYRVDTRPLDPTPPADMRPSRRSPS